MGSKISRRRLLKGVAAGTCGGLMHKLFQPAGDWFAYASPQTASFSAQPVFILVNFAGGASHNISPLYHGAYRDKNPTVSYGEADSTVLSAEQGLHPSLTAFSSEWNNGNLALLNMVGYPNPNRSHADSTDIWFRGTRYSGATTGGWAARMTCQFGEILSGVSLDGSSLLTRGDCNPPRALNGLGSLGENNLLGDEDSSYIRITRDSLLGSHVVPPNEPFAFVKGEMDSIARSLRLIQDQTNLELPNVGIPQPNGSGFQRDCVDAAKLIAARPLNVRFIYLERGGFDTHSNERGRLINNLNDFNTGIEYLIAVAKELGRWQDVVLVTMSEFCRTHENNSQGTDHGHAAPMFITGGRVRGSIYAPPPTAAQTLSGNFYKDYHIDFRQPFKEIVTAMGTNSDVIFPEQISFTPLNLFI